MPSLSLTGCKGLSDEQIHHYRTTGAQEGFGCFAENGYQAKTSELAKMTKMPISITRRAALYLAAHHQLHAEIIAGRGKGEYLFKLTQLDLFEDVKPLPSLWQRIKSKLFP